MRFPTYGRLCTQFYDLDKPEAPEHELAFYWQHYAAQGGPALEVMCGSGRFLLPFAARGADIDGIDASAPMLEACRRALAQQGLRAGLYEQHAESLALPRRYRYAFIPGGSMVLLDIAAQDRALARLAAHLESHGLLVVELPTPAATSSFVPTTEVRRVRRPDGAEIALTVDGSGGHRYDLIEHGQVLATETEHYGWHPRSSAEFTAALEANGFGWVEALRPFTQDEASDEDAEIVYLARRAD